MRGNPVMRAKRTTGPTPNTVLTLQCKLERCGIAGCEERPLLTSTVAGTGTIARRCAAHLGAADNHRDDVEQPGDKLVSWRPF